MDGKVQGRGRLMQGFSTNKMEVYCGNWEGNFKKGRGLQVFNDGSIYYGEWLDNMRHGFGMMHYSKPRQDQFGY